MNTVPCKYLRRHTSLVSENVFYLLPEADEKGIHKTYSRMKSIASSSLQEERFWILKSYENTPGEQYRIEI